MATLTIEGRKVTVDDSFLSLSPDQQQAAVEEIAASIGVKKGGDGSFLAKGAVDVVGGLADWVNPFDKPHGLNPFKDGTGSAKDTLASGFNAVGVDIPTRDPDSMGENFAYGAGQGLGALIPGQKVAQALRGAGGLLGGIADDAYRSLSGPVGALGEVATSAIGKASGSLADDAGLSPAAQGAAEILGGIAGGLSATAGSQILPNLARGGYNIAKRTVAPFTKSGAEVVARTHAHALMGGEDAARDAGRLIDAQNNPLGLTPAEMTGDRNLLALQAQAMKDSPDIRRAVEAGHAASRDAQEGVIRSQFGDVEDTRNFLADLQEKIRARLNAQVKAATQRASETRPQPGRTQMENSDIVSEQLRAARSAAGEDEAQLWAAIPRTLADGSEIKLPATNTNAAAKNVLKSTVWAREDEIPDIIRKAATKTEDTQTVDELTGLYSKLRLLEREALAGPVPNKTKAKMLNEAAQAVLHDLDAIQPTTELGRSVVAAREFTREMHEMFSQGAVGKLLRRTQQSDETIPTALALDVTVGAGGNKGADADRQITDATREWLGAESVADDAIDAYVRDGYDRAAYDRSGNFNRSTAESFERRNRPLLDRRATVSREIAADIDANARSQRMEATADAANTRLQTPSVSPSALFLKGQNGKAFENLLKADNPTRAIRAVMAQASKDTSGAALEGVKGSVSDYVISRGLAGNKMAETLADPKFMAAARMVLDERELNNLKFIAGQIGNRNAADAAVNDVGALSDAGNLLNMVVRIAGAKAGAKVARGGGDAGVSLQAAALGSSRAQRWLARLTNDRAQQMLRDAVTDPELMRTLLMTPKGLEAAPKRFNVMAPYVLGAAITQAE